MDNTFKSW